MRSTINHLISPQPRWLLISPAFVNAHVGAWHRPCTIVWSGSVFPLNGGSMSAQIIQLSDHRKVRTPATPRLMDASLKVFVAYLAIGIAINEAMIEAAQAGFRR